MTMFWNRKGQAGEARWNLGTQQGISGAKRSKGKFLLRTSIKSLEMHCGGTAQADPTESPQQNDMGQISIYYTQRDCDSTVSTYQTKALLGFQHEGQTLLLVCDVLDRHQDRQTPGLHLEPWKPWPGVQGIAPEGVEDEQKGNHSLDGGLWGELLYNTLTGVNEQGKHQNGCLQCQEEGKYNVCFLHYPKQCSSLIYWISLCKVKNDTLFYTYWKRGWRGDKMLEGRFGCNLNN